MRLLLMPLLLCLVQVSADGPDEGSISTNYEASHSSGNKNPGNHGSNLKIVHRRAALTEDVQLSRNKRQTVTCDSSARFRSPDGTCNNLNNPSWGSNNQPFQRLLNPVYDDDTKTPRLKKQNGDPLPSPRTVSTGVHDFDRQRLSRRASVMLMEWGQFLAHDVTATPLDDARMTSDKCCSVSLVTGGPHEDIATGGPCFPIIIAARDRHFTNTENRCMEFIRSYPDPDRTVREQLSELSAFVDGTNVYGRNDTEMTALRDSSGGKLAVKGANNLPESTTNYCIKDSDSDYCLQAGDSRVNVYPGLGATHTIFVRYHNYIAGELAKTHPTWTNDELFNNARKIVIAVLQRITFDEYLPAVIGDAAMATYGVSTPYSYNSSCNPSLYNVFSTAAFRFGHSMVPDGLMVNGEYVNSIDLFKRPNSVLNHLDSLVSGLASSQSENADRWYSLGMTDHLFEEKEFEGLDIASLNIQRGRDHGLPSYNDWRRHCNLGAVDFADLPRHSQRRFTNVYGDAEDIDLYSGALTETPENGGVVGPTYACLLGKQFAKLKHCDRYFWETTNTTTGFETDRQREQINRTRLSHIICRTTGVSSIQERVFSVPDDRRNRALACTEILEDEMDLSFF